MDEDIIYKNLCIENSDFVCVINPEIKADTDELYLVFKMLKRRYRSVEEDEKMRRLDYFGHPFAPGNEICLIDDVDLPKPLSVSSLATQFVAADEKRGKKNATERPEKKIKKKSSIFIDEDEFDPFNAEKAVNY